MKTKIEDIKEIRKFRNHLKDYKKGLKGGTFDFSYKLDQKIKGLDLRIKYLKENKK